MAGEASVFPRLDPEHALARAAREVNDHATAHGLEATLDWLGMDVGSGELAYLSEQRALRAVAAATHGTNDLDEQTAREIAASPMWRQMRVVLLGCYMDGFAIGWRAAQTVDDDGDA